MCGGGADSTPSPPSRQVPYSPQNTRPTSPVPKAAQSRRNGPPRPQRSTTENPTQTNRHRSGSEHQSPTRRPVQRHAPEVPPRTSASSTENLASTKQESNDFGHEPPAQQSTLLHRSRASLGALIPITEDPTSARQRSNDYETSAPAQQITQRHPPNAPSSRPISNIENPPSIYYESDSSRHESLTPELQELDIAAWLGGKKHTALSKEPRDISVIATIQNRLQGKVDVVCRVREHKPSYVRKRLPSRISPAREALIGTSEKELFEEEVENMKGLVHHHCVEFEGGYISPTFFAIIMSPVAEYNLAQYLDQQPSRAHLFRYFGCLSRALCYIHSNGLRHRNLKPENILIYKKDVYLTDFESSFGWSKLVGSTPISTEDTPWEPNWKASTWISPEAAKADSEDTDSKSDIWSLGCIFLEMETKVKGYSKTELNEFFQENDRSDWKQRHINYYEHAESISLWIKYLQSPEPFNTIYEFNTPLRWIKKMLDLDPTRRPSAERLVKWTSEEIHFSCSRCFQQGQGNQHHESTGSGEPFESSSRRAASGRENQNERQRQTRTDTGAPRSSQRPTTRG